jgi:seryl-tRNA synthetase
MLSIQLFRTDKEKIKEGLKKRNFPELTLVDQIIELDEERRQVQAAHDDLAADMNSSSKKIGILISQGNKEEAEKIKIEVANKKEAIKNLVKKLDELEKAQHALLVRIPNIPHSSVPQGKGAEDNVIVRSGGHTPSMETNCLPHWDLAEKFKLIDFERGNKITGSGFPVYTGQGARLQRALISYFLDFNTQAGYNEVYPPYLVNETTAYGTGQLPDKEGQMYHVTEDGLYLIPTAEVPVTNTYRDEILPLQDLPIKMTAYSPCFRREAGSYGKEVRGLNRVHQFDKVEIVQLVTPESSYEALEQMVGHVEKLILSLGLPYRLLRLCGGDMGFTSALTYDFEVYSAAQQRWLEVSSVSNFETFQTNRMKIRYRDEQGKTQLLHSLNGSALALPRIMACILENNQTTDGIQIPEVLHDYFKGTRITLA